MRFFLLLILLFTAFVCPAQRQVHYDSSKVAVRSFDAKALQTLKEDPDFSYDRYSQPGASYWDRFWAWMWQKIFKVMQNRSGRWFVYTVLILLSAAVVGLFLVKVTGMNKTGWLSRRNKPALDFSTAAEDINSISFDDAIRDAIDTRNFRLAVRLLYLQSLKTLADRGFIDWKLNKTNSDYVKEVSDKPWHGLFHTLTYSFEYAWYGEANIERDAFDHLNRQFQQFNTQL